MLVEDERGGEDEVLVEVGEVHGRLLGAAGKRRAAFCRAGCSELGAAVAEKPLQPTVYSGLNLNQYGVASPCRTICTVCGFVALS